MEPDSESDGGWLGSKQGPSFPQIMAAESQLTPQEATWVPRPLSLLHSSVFFLLFLKKVLTVLTLGSDLTLALTRVSNEETFEEKGGLDPSSKFHSHKPSL